MGEVVQPGPGRGIEALLAHVEWVKRLARVLVVDEHDAADVEQETWRRALERPPGHAANLRRWLGAVARNVARKLVRARQTRLDHEAAAPHALAASAADVTARAELHRRVVDAVLRLEELYRTPLLLRFFDDLSAQDVARELGVPVETARTRIKRGLALVRERLSAELSRGGREWTLALAPLLAGRGASAAAGTTAAVAAASTGATGLTVAGLNLGGAVVSKLLQIGVATVVAALVTTGTYVIWTTPRHPEIRVAEGASAPPAEPLAPAAVPEPTAPDVASAREPVDRAGGELTTSAATLGTIEGKVVDAQGRPVAGATVGIDRLGASFWWNELNFPRGFRQFLGAPPAGEHTWRATKTAIDGGFAFDGIDPQVRWAIGAMHDPLGMRWSEIVAFDGAPPRAKVLVALEGGTVVFGTVRDPLGNPVAGTSVSLHGSRSQADSKTPEYMGEAEDFINTGEDGRYRTLPLRWRSVWIHAYVHKGRPDLARLALPWRTLPDTPEVQLDLTLPFLTTLRGRVLGPDGEPARLRETVLPRLGADVRRLQSKDTLAVVAFAKDPREHPDLIEQLSRNRPPGRSSSATDRVYGTLFVTEDRYEVPVHSEELRFVAILARDRLLGIAEVPSPTTAPDVVIDPALVPERSLLHGLVLHFRDGRDGSSLPGVHVNAKTTRRTRDGTLRSELLSFAAPDELPADREIALPLFPCVVRVERDGFLDRSIAIDPSRRGAPSELTVELVPAGGSIALHLESEDGAPIADATFAVYRASDGEPVEIDWRAKTDEAGDCTLAAMPAGECIVVAQKQGFAPAAGRVTIDGEGTPLDLVLESGYEVTLRGRLPDGTPAPAGLVAILDEEGARLHDQFLANAGATRLAGGKLRLTDGRYTIRCLVPGEYEGSATFIAAPGAEIDVELVRIE